MWKEALPNNTYMELLYLLLCAVSVKFTLSSKMPIVWFESEIIS